MYSGLLQLCECPVTASVAPFVKYDVAFAPDDPVPLVDVVVLIGNGFIGDIAEWEFKCM